MTKTVYKQKCFFYVITKNLNWEISTSFRRWDGIEDEKWRFQKKQYLNKPIFEQIEI